MGVMEGCSQPQLIPSDLWLRAFTRVHHMQLRTSWAPIGSFLLIPSIARTRARLGRGTTHGGAGSVGHSIDDLGSVQIK